LDLDAADEPQRRDQRAGQRRRDRGDQAAARALGQRLGVGLPVVVEVVVGEGVVIGHSNLRASMGRSDAARAAG
jgi:hypothetical protein